MSDFQIHLPTEDLDMDDDERELIEAIVSLHEQAHGLDPIRFCTKAPCNHLYLADWRGPARPELIGRG